MTGIVSPRWIDHGEMVPRSPCESFFTHFDDICEIMARTM